MQALERQYSYDPRTGDLPRDENRVRVRVTVASDSGASVSVFRFDKPGTYEIVCYESELEDLRSRVRTPEHEQAVQFAKNAAALDFDDWVEEKLKGRVGVEREIEERKLRHQCPVFWSQWKYLKPAGAQFGIDLRDGIPPLSAVEVIDEQVGPPATRDNQARETTSKMGHEIAQAIREGNAEVMKALAEVIQRSNQQRRK